MRLKVNILWAAGAVLFAASCSSDDFQGIAVEGDGNVNFRVELPADLGTRTRSFADGYSANSLQVAVFQGEENKMVASQSLTFDNGSLAKTVSFKLASGQSYRIAFFAQQSSGSPYTFTFADNQAEVTLDYAKMTNYNSTDYDCFWALEETGIVTEAINKTIILTRPVAQVNWGSNDLDEEILVPVYGENLANHVSKVTVAGVCDKLDMLTGNVSSTEGFDGKVTFNYTVRPDATKESFPKNPDTYKYVSMQYLMVPASSSLVDLVLYHSVAPGTDGDSKVTVSQTPVQANYRTNIYGALLTKTADYEVEKDPNWGGENDFDLDGEEVAEGVVYVEEEKSYYIVSKDGLKNFSAMTNGETRTGVKTFEGETFILNCDVDLEGELWTPIAMSFEGTFDGNSHKVYNVKVRTENNVTAGFFNGYKAKVKNLHLVNVDIEGHYKVGGIAGDALVSSFENCSVTGGRIVSTPWLKNGEEYDDANYIGGIVGYLSAENMATVKNCTVKDVDIVAYRKVGGIAGGMQFKNAVISGCHVENVNVVADMRETNYDGYPRQADCGEIVGIIQGGATMGEGNTTKNVTVTVLTADAMKGGEVVIPIALETISVPADLTSALTVKINAPVGKVTLPASNSKAITIEVAKDVEYPEVLFTSNSTLDGFTLKGDPDSNKQFEGFNWADGSTTARPTLLKNTTFEGVNFVKYGYYSHYNVSSENLVFRNCTFSDMEKPAVDFQHANGGTLNDYTKNLTIEGCTVEFSPDVAAGINGLYITDVEGDIIVKNNTVNGATAHGISIAANADTQGEKKDYQASSVIVTGNKVSGKTKDGIKVTSEHCAITVSGNTTAVTENGIRIKNCAVGNDISVTGNAIDMVNAISFNEAEGEPYGILVINSRENSEASKLTVNGNTFKNSERTISIVNVKRKDVSQVQE